MTNGEKLHYKLPAGNVQIAFSGGRTSAYMLYQILESNGPLPERVTVSFQNTGREMPQTLDFVQQCAERWNVRVIWLEYRPAMPLYEVVSHNSASRNGEPFEALIRRRKFLPNQVARFCTQELKIKTVRRYLVALGWKNWVNVTGIRADEPRRRRPDFERIKGIRHFSWQPLFNAGVSKERVGQFWRAQPFDLDLPNINGTTPLGNCDGCFLKSEKTLATLARDYPERHAWWEQMEKTASGLCSSPSGARFRQAFSRAEMGDFVDRQGDWIFDSADALCETDYGECTG